MEQTVFCHIDKSFCILVCHIEIEARLVNIRAVNRTAVSSLVTVYALGRQTCRQIVSTRNLTRALSERAVRRQTIRSIVSSILARPSLFLRRVHNGVSKWDSTKCLRSRNVGAVKKNKERNSKMLLCQ
jgi:hypothetical protein